jgi:hypothetical protein
VAGRRGRGGGSGDSSCRRSGGGEAGNSSAGVGGCERKRGGGGEGGCMTTGGERDEEGRDDVLAVNSTLRGALPQLRQVAGSA